MKARATARSSARAAPDRRAAAAAPRRRLRDRRRSTGRRSLGRRDPVPSLLELQERFGGRRVLITGGGGSIGRALRRSCAASAPSAITLLDGHEASLTADRRAARGRRARALTSSATSATRAGSSASWRRRGRTSSSTSPPTSTSTGPRSIPEEFVDTNLHGSWNVLRAADARRRRDRRRRLDGQGRARGELLRPHEALHGAAHRVRRAARRRAADRRALRQRARQRRQRLRALPAPGARRTCRSPSPTPGWCATGSRWRTRRRSPPTRALLAAEGVALAAPADAVKLTVGELAERIWRAARPRRARPSIDVVGIRPGETLSEVLTGPGETLGRPSATRASPPIEGEIPTAGPAWVPSGCPSAAAARRSRAVWLEAMRRPGLLVPSAAAAK